MSDESIKPPITSNNSFTPLIDYYGYKMRLKFNGRCLIQSKASYTHEKILNIYIVYNLAGSSSLSLPLSLCLCLSLSDDPTLKNCLFAAVSLTKNANMDKYKYSGYGIGFD